MTGPTALAEVDYTAHPGLYRIVGKPGEVYLIDSRVRISAEGSGEWMTLSTTSSVEDGIPHDHNEEMDVLRTGCKHTFVCHTDQDPPRPTMIRQSACNTIERIA